MEDLAWLVGHRFESLTRREFDWLVAFDKGVTLTIACLWRLVERGRIRCTSEDDGHPFGLPAPVNAAAEVNARLVGASVEAVDLRTDLLDLEVRFTTGRALQLIATSAGYEAWELCGPKRHFVAAPTGDPSPGSKREGTPPSGG